MRRAGRFHGRLLSGLQSTDDFLEHWIVVAVGNFNPGIQTPFGDSLLAHRSLAPTGSYCGNGHASVTSRCSEIKSP